MTMGTTFRMRLAGRTAEVRPIYGEVRELCRHYLAADEGAPDITVTVTPEDIAREAAESARQGREMVPQPYLETVAVHRRIAVSMLRKMMVAKSVWETLCLHLEFQSSRV